LFQTGFALRDTEILKRSSEELFRLRPGSAAWRNNRAALLLISGENPSEALQLTLEGLAQNPSSIVLRINRAIALLQNQRAQEAGPLLDGIDPTRLSPEIANNYHYVRALTHAALNHPEQARLSARQVRQESLFPEQVRRLAEAIPDSP
jgi:predicted Zn-dependent protease